MQIGKKVGQVYNIRFLINQRYEQMPMQALMSFFQKKDKNFGSEWSGMKTIRLQINALTKTNLFVRSFLILCCKILI